MTATAGSTVWGDPGSGAGQTDLQQAYDNSPTPGAQITLDNVPNPIGIKGSVAGQIFVIQDVPGTTDIFEFTDVQMTVRAPILFDVNLDNYQPANPTAFLWNTSFTLTNPLIGGFIGSTGNVTLQNGTFIWGLLSEQRQYISDTTLGFAAYTLLNALPIFREGSTDLLLAALILNVGAQHRRTTSGTSTTGGVNGINFAPSNNPQVAGATMTSTGYNGIVLQPSFSTVLGSTANLGTIVGIRTNQPAVALFGTAAGVETMTAYYTVDAFPAGFTFGGVNATVEVVRSGLTAGTNKRFLNNFGGAESDFAGGSIHLNDGTLVKYGNTVAAPDVTTQWNNATATWLTAFAANAGQLRISNPASGRLLFTQTDDAQEFNLACLKFSLGAQTGAVGNQKGVFVSGAETVTVAGEYSQFLLTQAANDTINAALSLYAGWTINAPTPTLGTGSITDSVGLRIGGNPGAGTNRYGLHIISNPSGGSGENYPMYVEFGTSRINELIVNDPGFEGSGIDVNGVNYDSALKVSNLGGGNQAQFILHRHSTTEAPFIVTARSNTNDATHALVANAQDLFGVIGTGWDGTDYKIAGRMNLTVDGTPGANDMPGAWEFLTTANGAATPTLALRITNAQRLDFQTNQALGGGATATLGTIGGSGPTTAAQAQWLEIEINGVVHWVPAWT